MEMTEAKGQRNWTCTERGSKQNFISNAKEKCGWEDEETTDLLKDGGKIVLEKLAALYTQLLKTSSVPEPRKNDNIIWLDNKWGAKDLTNYRPIRLPPVAYKLFAKVIGKGIKKTLNFNQPMDQAGFRKSYATIDNIHTLNQVIE